LGPAVKAMVIKTVQKAKAGMKKPFKPTVPKKPLTATPKAGSAGRTQIRTGFAGKKPWTPRKPETTGQWVFVPDSKAPAFGKTQRPAFGKTQSKFKGKGRGKERAGPKKLPKDFTFDGDARYTGKVGAYFKMKGYGWIEPDEEDIAPDGKVFVYWKGITSEDRYPFLTKGQEVEFGLTKIQGGLRAKKVCLPGGEPIANQDEQDAQKEFIGGQTMRYTGKLKFFDPRKGFGYVKIDEDMEVDGDVPKEVRVETAEVNAGGRQPNSMKDIQVEFGIWKTKKGHHKVYNMTLPGGDALSKEVLEKRSTMGSKTYKGKIATWMFKHGWGFVSLDKGQTIPPQVKSKIAAMNKATKDKGKKVEEENQLYFRRSDCKAGFRPEKGQDVTFQIYIDEKGAGACELGD